MKVSVIFSTRRWNFFSWLIRKFEGSDFSHVAFLIEMENVDGELGRQVIHASGTKVHFTSYEEFAKNNSIMRKVNLELSHENKSKFLTIIDELKGIGFGYLEIVGIGIDRILRLFSLKIGNILGNDLRTLICSEFVGYVLRQIGFKLLGFNLNNDGPKKLYEVLNADN